MNLSHNRMTGMAGVLASLVLALPMVPGAPTRGTERPLAGGGDARRYLAVDRELQGELRNLQLTLGQAGNQRVILEKFDAPWEERHNIGGFEYISGVFRDHEGRYRLYYNVTQPAIFTQAMLRREAVAVAFSADGINWEKPKLNIAKHLVDDPDSNLINVEPHPGMDQGKYYRAGPVFYDPRAPAESRYKLSWRVYGDVYVAVSSDGLNFVTKGQAFRHKADTMHSAFFDPRTNEYVMYGRKRGDWNSEPADRRGVVRHASRNWTDAPWSTVGQVVIDPKDVWDYSETIQPQVYAPAIQYYHGQYIGLPPIFFTDTNRGPVNRPDRKTGTFYPILMHSRDGIQWTFPDRWHPVIDLQPHLRVSSYELASSKQAEVGLICASGDMLEIDGRLLIYYTAREGTHYEEQPLDRKSVHVAFMRVDGFASLGTLPGRPGEWLTSEIAVPADARNLVVNAQVAGKLRAEVIDAANGKPIAGLTLAEAKEVSGDELALNMQWRSATLAAAAGRTVRLRFAVDDGKIYSFAFSGTP